MPETQAGIYIGREGENRKGQAITIAATAASLCIYLNPVNLLSREEMTLFPDASNNLVPSVHFLPFAL